MRDAIWGSAVSTWPRRRKREATKKRLAHAGSPGKGLVMQVEFEMCLGLGRAGRAGRVEVGRPSRSIKESRKRLAGAYSNRDKGQAQAATDRAGVARLKRWSARLRSAQRPKRCLVQVVYPGTVGTYCTCSPSAVPHCPPRPPCVCAACSGHPVFLSSFSCWHPPKPCTIPNCTSLPLHVTVPSQWHPRPTCGDGVKTDELE